MGWQGWLIIIGSAAMFVLMFFFAGCSRCPYCESKYIKPDGEGAWRCRQCGKGFDNDQVIYK